jgi:membrane-associated phospholipid phosphatase
VVISGPYNYYYYNGTAYPSWLSFLIFGAAVVSISRIYLERHYPFDVLAGSFIGFLCAGLVLFIF